MSDSKQTVERFVKLLIENDALKQFPVGDRTFALRQVLKLRKHSDIVFDTIETVLDLWTKAKDEGKANDQEQEGSEGAGHKEDAPGPEPTERG